MIFLYLLAVFITAITGNMSEVIATLNLKLGMDLNFLVYFIFFFFLIAIAQRLLLK